MRIEGATCLVTGANRGIGLAIARELATRPVRLLVAARDPAKVPPIEPPPGGAGEVRAVRVDLSSREQIEACAAELGSALEGVDVLVNNAGLLSVGQLELTPLDEIYASLQVNLLGTIHLTRLVLPGMLRRGRGRIANNASISGYAFLPGSSVYAASKAGVVAHSEALRRELRGTGVSVLHAVTPSVDTDMMDSLQERTKGQFDTGAWKRTSPEDWAAKLVRAIESDAHVLDPGGNERLAKLASRGPAFLLDAISRRAFSRR